MAVENLVVKDTRDKETKGILKLLFVVNSGSGNNNTDWPKEIEEYFKSSNHSIELFHLDEGFKIEALKEKVASFKPDTIVAVGGDGTVCLVADCLLQTDITLGILPAGSANGLAKELGISVDPKEALQTLMEGNEKKIHLVSINDRLCIHLSDIGFNAYMLKKFESESTRGGWGYLKATIKASWRVFLSKQFMRVTLTLNNETIRVKAVMIVIANATKYGSGAVINPAGSVDDELFEVIVVKKISVAELFKMLVTHSPFHPDKTVLYQTNQLTMQTTRKVHFQVDGEYLGKVNKVEATLLPAAIKIIVPPVQ